MSNSKARTPTASSTNRRGSSSPAPKSANNDKLRVHLLDTCYICGNNFSSARQTIMHVRRIHGYGLPSRRQGYNRPQNKKLIYVRERNGEWDHEEIACPSCWFHCPEEGLTDLNEHTRNEHNPEKVDPNKEDDDGYTSAASAASAASDTSRRSHRRASTSSVQSGGGRSREGSASQISQETVKEISAKIDELSNIFKSLFNL